MMLSLFYLTETGFWKNSKSMRKNTSLRTSERLNTFIYREYERNGKGGMFPLKTPSGNQKKVQLWYQLAEYLIENDIF